MACKPKKLVIFVNSLPELDINIQTTFISGDSSMVKRKFDRYGRNLIVKGHF
jgi:hypothetical protein